MTLIYMLQSKTKEHIWLADFGVSLITASKVCRAQVYQEKGFSALLISGSTWEGTSLSSSTEEFP